MTAAEGVDKVDRGRIVRLVRRLNAALGHHRVRVAHAELRDDHGLCADIVGLNGRRSARAAAADDEHVDVIAHVAQVDVACLDAAVRLEHLGQLVRHLLALVRADAQGRKFALFVIGMIGRKQPILLVGRHAGGLIGDVRGARRLDRLQRFLKILCIHCRAPPYFSISRLL